MKKLFFPLVAVVGLTAMSFTTAKADTSKAREVSMEELNDVEGSTVIQYKVWRNVIETNVYKSLEDMESVSKMDNILAKY